MPGATGERGFDVPYELLGYQPAPRAVGVPPPRPSTVDDWPDLGRADLAKLLEQVVGDLHVASQEEADAQYDSTVQGNTAYGPSMGGAVSSGMAQYGRRYRVPTTYWAGTPVEGSAGRRRLRHRLLALALRGASAVSGNPSPWLAGLSGQTLESRVPTARAGS
jgi:hypothetical protein